MSDPIALRPPMPSDRWTWTRARIGSLGLIAAVLLLIASVVITSAPDTDPEPPRLPAIAAASPSATATSDPAASSPSVQIVPPTEAIDIADCTTEPRPPGTVALLLDAHGGVAPPSENRPYEIGTEPSAEMLAAIEATLRQIVACRYEGFEAMTASDGGSIDLDNRLLALYSDRFVAEMAAVIEGGVNSDGFEVFKPPFRSLDSAVLAIQEASQWRDGSVLVSIAIPAGYGEGSAYDATSFEMRFVSQGDRWLIDEWSLRSSYWDRTLGEPLPPTPQAVQVIATATSTLVSRGESLTDLVVGRKTTISVANLGSVPLRFALPTLAFEVTVEPGHSVDLRVNLPAGTYPIDAIPDGGDDLVSDALTLHPDPDAPATPEPQSPYVRIRPQDEAIDIAECTTEPRPPGTVAQMREALRGTPEIGLPRSSQAYDWAPSLGWPEPDPETRLGIEETLRQLVACRFSFLPPGAETYDLDNRYLALFSERYVVGLAIEMEGDVSRLPFSPYDSAPLTIVDIAEHEDGRVLVSLGDLPGFTGTVFVLFEMQHGKWVVDDWGDIRFDQGRSAYSTPASALPDRRAPARVTVITTNELGETWQEPWGEGQPLPAGTEFTLTVVNLGDMSLRFEMPGLIGATDVGAGHSLDLRVIAPPGTYALDAIPEGGEDLVDDAVTFQLNSDPAATPEPQADATDTTNASPYVRIRSQDEAVDIAECTTQPRTPGTVAQLRAAHGGTPESWLSSSGLDPVMEGPDPAPEIMTGIEGMLRQLVACRFSGMATLGAEAYDLDSRHLALFSERYVVELAMHMEGGGFRIPFQPNDSAPLPIIDASQNPDGSVLVRLGDVPGHGQGTIFLLLVWERGGWVIDDWGNITFAAGPNDPATPAASEMLGVVPIIATDDLAGAWNQPSNDELLAETDVIFTIANLGSETVRFEIPDLGFAVDIAAGHSLDLVVNAPPGTYPLNLTHPGSPDMLDTELALVPDPGGTPTATPLP